MDLKELNETLLKFLEGDVVSFTDFKQKKTAQRRDQRNKEFMAQYGDELNKDLEKWNKDNLIADITKIKVNWAEGPIKNPHYKDGEEFSYENFQKDVFAKDYLNSMGEHYDKCDITIFCDINGEEKQYNYRFTIGGGKKECDIYNVLPLIIESKEHKKVLIANDPVEYEENYYKGLAKEYSIETPNNPMNDPIVKDYTKAPLDVQEGDILVRNWGYSMVLVDFYKVIERKKSSIKVAKLEDKIVSGDGMQGSCIPTNDTEENRTVDGKLFRIGVKWAKDAVCQIDGHSVYYWDGKPQHFDRLD